jgi:hypothetical protein
VRSEAKLADVLAGKAIPADNGELLDLAKLCALKRRHVAAVRFCGDAFTADPKLASDGEARHRYEAACSAALAAAGQGTDAEKLDDQERRRLRDHSLTWLRAELDAWSTQLNGKRPNKRQATRPIIQHWQRDIDLASVREPDALQKLSSEEQQSWRKLWADVGEMLEAGPSVECGPDSCQIVVGGGDYLSVLLSFSQRQTPDFICPPRVSTERDSHVDSSAIPGPLDGSKSIHLPRGTHFWTYSELDDTCGERRPRV